jgi:WD40 repeat protein
VGDLQRDLEAYQNGFATSAENATFSRQIRLLVNRHKGVFGTLAAAWLVITVLAVWFIINLRASEQTAMRNEKRAISEKEIARRALAQSQIAVADEAFRRADVAGMNFALQACPEDLRGQDWQYLAAKRDMSSGDFKVAGFESPTCVAEVPGQPGQFALANDRGDVGIADVATGKLLRTIKTGRFGIKTMIFSGDGHVLGVGRNKPAQVELYDAVSGARQKSFTLPGDILFAFHLGRDATQLAALLGMPVEKMDLLLLDSQTGATRWKRIGQFTSVLIHPGGDRVSVTGQNRVKHFTLIKTQDGTDIVKLPVFAISQAVSPDGKTLAVGTQSGDLLLLDAATGVEIQRGKLHSATLREVAWTADNRLITMGTEGKIRDGRWVLKLWDATDLSPMGMFFGLRTGPPVHWRFSAETGHLLTEENPPRLWHIPVGLEVAKIPQGSEIGWSGCFLSDTMLLARKGLSFARYDLSTPGKVTELSGYYPNSYCMAAVHWPSGQFAIAKNINAEPFGFKVFAVQKNEVTERLAKAVPGRIHGLDFDPSGERLAAIFQAGGVQVFSTKTGELQLRVTGRFEHAVFAGGEGNLIALNARTVKADDVENDLVLLDAKGRTLGTVSNHFRVNALAASSGRAIVAIGGTDQTVHVYDAATLQERIAFRAHDGDIGALAFHPTAPIIASASIDGSVKLWDYRSGKLLGYFLGLGGMPFTLSFSPNGRLLMVDGQDKATRVYDVAEVKAP